MTIPGKRAARAAASGRLLFGLLAITAATPASAIMNGVGQDIFPVTAIFQSSGTVTYSNAVNAGVTISSGLVVSNGNVGIGTASPAAKLDVQGGNINAQYGVSAATGVFSTSLTVRGNPVAVLADTQTFTGANTFSSTAAFTAQNASVAGVTISSGLVVSNGNVGIGTTAPAYKLQVAGGNIKSDYGVLATTVVYVPQASTPTWPLMGTMYYSSNTNKIRVSTAANNTSWVDLMVTANGVAGEVLDLNAHTKMKAYLSTSQSIPNNLVATKVRLNSEVYDNLGEFDSTTNYRWTALYGGYYYVIGAVSYVDPGSGKAIQVMIYKNGSIVERGDNTGSSGSYSSCLTSDILLLAAGDYVEMYTAQDGVSSKSIAVTFTYMTIFRIP